MKKGIPCNDLRKVSAAECNSIVYTFVTEDGLTPSSCTVSVGDVDPLTGRPITDVEFFREYHRAANREAYYNSRAVQVPYSSEEKEARREERKKIAEDFRREYGYTPSPETVAYLQEERWPDRYVRSLDGNKSEGEEIPEDKLREFADPKAEKAFQDVEDDRVERLREFASTLEGRLKDVYELMLMEEAGAVDRKTRSDLRKKWGRTVKTISRDREKIRAMIREWMKDVTIHSFSGEKTGERSADAEQKARRVNE